MLPERVIIESAHALASTLPGHTIEALATAIRVCPAGSLRSEITHRVPHHHHRNLCLSFVERWRTEAMAVEPGMVAMALQMAAFSTRQHREDQSVELVWTGPGTEPTSFRRTEQAILQVLDAAQSRITLVSFAVYRIPNIARSLVEAARRGVRLTVIVETPDRIEGQGEYSTIRALGSEVTACSTLYYWPQANRPLGINHKVGLLHVKCAVADGKWLFLSSANLTQQAFTINLELGLLVTGGHLPGQGGVLALLNGGARYPFMH